MSIRDIVIISISWLLYAASTTGFQGDDSCLNVSPSAAALGLQFPVVLPPQNSYHYLTQTGQLCALQNTFADPEDF